MKTIKSRRGFEINVVCAACEHHTSFAMGSGEVKRRCDIKKKWVLAQDTCPKCQVNAKLLNL